MPDSVLESGSIIGEKYRIEGLIGRGGFSRVYRGLHSAMDRRVAIKVFDPTQHDDADSSLGRRRAERFEREAQLVSRLQHPNTITIFDFGIEDDGRAFLVMEFVEGPTLQELIEDHGAIDPARAVTIFLQVLGSLEEAHHREILHRDLKPANVMLATNFKGDDVVKVLDFGIARVLQSEPETDSSSDSKLFLGTPRYAAPEQLTGAGLSLATDIYGVGAVLWECLLGTKMVPTNDIRECIGHATDDTLWTVPDGADLDADLRTIVERAVSKSPQKRFSNASAMRRALEQSATIERNDLPELVSESPFGTSGQVFDPNVVDTGDDSIPLLDDNFDDKEATPQPAPIRSAPPAIPEPKESLELDIPDADDAPIPPPTKPTDSSSTQWSSNTEPAPPSEHRHRPPPTDPSNGAAASNTDRSPLMLGAIATVLVGAVAVVVWTVTDDAPADEEEATQVATPQHGDGDQAGDIDIDDPQPAADEDFELADNSPFTFDGIITALRTENWQIDRARDTVEMPGYNYRTLRIASGDDRLLVRLYETKRPGIIDEVLDSLDQPSQAVVLDHIVVDIEPVEHHHRRAASETREFLDYFGTTVSEQ